MEKYLQSDEIKLRYTIQGQGTPLVLLHGYLESLEIWAPLAKQLAEYFQVICPDLPGHGKSTFVDEAVTMDDMADATEAILVNESIEKCILVGHSMGGYATLAFVEKYASMLHGFCLFHSSPFADNEDKKAARTREIGLVNDGKKKLIIGTNIPKAFADENLGPLRNEVERAKNIALQTPDNGIIGALRGMMIRPERSKLLDNQIPKLFILGKKDNYIPFNNMLPILKKAKNGEVVIFENSGHMGFVEETEKAIDTLKSFVFHAVPQ